MIPGKCLPSGEFKQGAAKILIRYSGSCEPAGAQPGVGGT